MLIKFGKMNEKFFYGFHYNIEWFDKKGLGSLTNGLAFSIIIAETKINVNNDKEREYGKYIVSIHGRGGIIDSHEFDLRNYFGSDCAIAVQYYNDGDEASISKGYNDDKRWQCVYEITRYLSIFEKI